MLAVYHVNRFRKSFLTALNAERYARTDSSEYRGIAYDYV